MTATNTMSVEEFNAMRSESDSHRQGIINAMKNNQDTNQELIEAMSAKAFLISRTNETIKVPIASATGMKDIEIRARLSKHELESHERFLTWFKVAAKELDSEIGNRVTAEFLSRICVDPELDIEFWLSPDLDPSIGQEILIAYFTEPARRMAAIKKFRDERVRAELHGDAPALRVDIADVHGSR
jgi:hypothetical protein